MIEMPGTLRCRLCGGTRSVTLTLGVHNNEVERREGKVRFNVKNVTVQNPGDWFINDHGEPTCPSCAKPK